MIYRVTRRQEIDCHHRLVDTVDPDSPCRRDHGHRYAFEATFETEHLTKGVVVDFGHVSQVIKAYDHLSWNLHLENPTAEAILALVARDLDVLCATKYQGLPQLVRLKLWETPSSSAELIF